jgi:hypothetical protein
MVGSLAPYGTEYLLEIHDWTDVYNFSTARNYVSGTVSNWEILRGTSHTDSIYAKAMDQYIASQIQSLEGRLLVFREFELEVGTKCRQAFGKRESYLGNANTCSSK